jgi:drug/metabolite transporter (DMT)-like permease
MTFVLTCLAMLAFAANSLLARGALADGAIDALSFTAIRLVSGAVALGLLLRWQRGAWRPVPGSWPSAAALFVYAIGFSLAYLRLGAATGALILFATVQAGMIAWGFRRGHRANLAELAGLVIALCAFVSLLLPGLHTPDLLGSVLMMAAGLGWAAYSLRGSGSVFPLGDTAGNFMRTTLFCVPLAGLALAGGHATGSGILLALASGCITSGLGYAIWYRALRGLAPIQAATVQLTVPLIATIGGVVLLSETITARLVIAGTCILGGVGLTILSKTRQRHR